MTEHAAYQVVARRYRPQRFDELIGQEHVGRGLSNAIQSGRIGHAYLFCGARGTGKTSAARILAKALQCAAGPAAEPCNACDSCRAVAAGEDVDVVEIDAASNRGVDEIRQLRQNVAVRPAHGRYKVYIIDEVHMLTREAFNALLKTLEEPPAHVKFVLCTTEADKLPITILSRCQRFDFGIVAPAAIARRLAQIVEAEGADVSAEALEIIARRAAGSMRDSQSLLEQLLGASTGRIGADEVHAMIGTGREERVGAILTAVAGRDAPAALAALDAAVQGGADPGGVLDQLVAALRDCLLASVGCGREMLGDRGTLGVDVAALGGSLGTATILAMLQIVDQALSRMAVSGHAGVLAEMTVVRLATLEDLDSLAAAVDRVGSAAAAAPNQPAPRPQPVTRPQAAARTAPAVQPPAPDPVEKKKADLTPAAAADQTPAGGISAAPAAAPADAAPAPPTEPLAAWLAAAAESGGLAADFAATATAAAWRDDAIDVTIPAAQALAFLSRAEVSAGISRALAGIAGRSVAIRLVAGAEPVRPAAGPTTAADRGERAGPAASQAALVRQAAEHPLVARARAAFDAAIRRVDPPRPPPAGRSAAGADAGREADAAAAALVPVAAEEEDDDG